MEKLTTADRLKQIMYERNIKQVDILEACKPFCEKYGVKLGKNDLSQYISGKVTPGQDKLTILGLALNVNEVWLMGYNLPSGRNDLECIEQNMKNSNYCNLISQCHNNDVFNAVKLLVKLDTVDLARIIERMEQMLEADKYNIEKESSNEKVV